MLTRRILQSLNSHHKIFKGTSLPLYLYFGQKFNSQHNSAMQKTIQFIVNNRNLIGLISLPIGLAFMMQYLPANKTSWANLQQQIHASNIKSIKYFREFTNDRCKVRFTIKDACQDMKSTDVFEVTDLPHDAYSVLLEQSEKNDFNFSATCTDAYYIGLFMTILLFAIYRRIFYPNLPLFSKKNTPKSPPSNKSSFK